MNQRIRELAEQAEWRFADQATGEFSEYDQRLAKIAELIVQECAKVCDDIDSEYEGEDVLATWCAKAIREHFGVGE